MSNAHFAKTPNISIPRTRFNMPFNHATTFNHGDLIPIDCFEVLPGDSFKLKLSSLIRMSTPIVPIFGNIRCYIHAFFVPMRLVWDKTQRFYGENDTSAGPVLSSIPQIPQANAYFDDEGDDSIPVGSVSDYLGKPIYGTGQQASDVSFMNDQIYMSVLKERCYWLICNEWYRAQQLENPIIISKVGTGKSSSNRIGNLGDGSVITFSNMPYKVCKQYDYFTASTTAPQYGAAVTLPLGQYAPVITKSNQQVYTSANPAEAPLYFTKLNGGYFSTDRPLGVHADNSPSRDELRAGASTSSDFTNSDNRLVPVNLYADLSNATAATINSIRYAFQVQKYLERSNFGSRFFEMLAVHYGVTSPDARLQRPEYLGGTKFDINVNQVLSTADYTAGATQKVGQVGAVSVTGNSSHIFTKGFVEPGYVLVLLSTRHEQTYSQGILREDTKLERLEFYSPEFAHLGDQEVLNREIYAPASGDGDGVFGYQEHWAEYKYRPNRVSGLLNPNAANSLNFWTLANKYISAPALNATFIKERRDELTRCLTTGANGPDYIGDFYFDYEATRELPLVCIPGLVDHFGTM